MKRRSALPFILGIVLILCGLCAAVIFGLRTYRGAEQSRLIAAELDEILPERTAGSLGMQANGDMPTLEIAGKDYAAVLEIPAFGIALPVANEWDGKKLYSSPARYYGSVYDGSLIIGGTGSDRQLGFCGSIEHGAAVVITDMTGAQFAYTVVRIDRAKHAGNQWLMDEEHDLTIFCHDVLSMEYIAVRCDAAI